MISPSTTSQIVCEAITQSRNRLHFSRFLLSQMFQTSQCRFQQFSGPERRLIMRDVVKTSSHRNALESILLFSLFAGVSHITVPILSAVRWLIMRNGVKMAS